jgi:hypothetical protein
MSPYAQSKKADRARLTVGEIYVYRCRNRSGQGRNRALHDGQRVRLVALESKPSGGGIWVARKGIKYVVSPFSLREPPVPRPARSPHARAA